VLSDKEAELRGLVSSVFASHREAIQLYEEAVASGLNFPFVDRLGRHRDSLRRLSDRIHDAALTEWDLKRGAVPRRNR
jgi:hypothetical protein